MKASREIALLRALLAAQCQSAGEKEVIYQAAGAATGLTVTFDVYKPDQTKDTFQSGIAVPIGATGRYYIAFSADGPGWFVLIEDSNDGKAVKYF